MLHALGRVLEALKQQDRVTGPSLDIQQSRKCVISEVIRMQSDIVGGKEMENKNEAKERHITDSSEKAKTTF